MISEEVRRAYKSHRERQEDHGLGYYPNCDVFADFARDTLAQLREAEFKTVHRLEELHGVVWCIDCSYGTIDNGEYDPRHKWQFADWQRAAEEELRGT